jgi:hypothetical protein
VETVAFMKNSIASRLVAVGAIASLSFSSALAADTNPIVPGAVAPQTTASAPPAKLPYGVDDILKLSRAQINEDIILNYIQSSGTIYNLAPQDIVYLRNEGVADRVVNAMLDQRKRVIEAAAQQPASPAVPATPTVPDAGMVPAAPAYTYSTATLEPQAASSLYVIPYPPRTYAYYGTYSPYSPYSYYRPYYYGGYGGYCGSGLGFGFTYSSGYHHGGYGGYPGWYRGGYYGANRGGSYAAHGAARAGFHGGRHR